MKVDSELAQLLKKKMNEKEKQQAEKGDEEEDCLTLNSMQYVKS